MKNKKYQDQNIRHNTDADDDNFSMQGYRQLALSVIALAVQDAQRFAISAAATEVSRARHAVTHKSKTMEMWCEVAGVSYTKLLMWGNKNIAGWVKADLAEKVRRDKEKAAKLAAKAAVKNNQTDHPFGRHLIAA